MSRFVIILATLQLVLMLVNAIKFDKAVFGGMIRKKKLNARRKNNSKDRYFYLGKDPTQPGSDSELLVYGKNKWIVRKKMPDPNHGLRDVYSGEMEIKGAIHPTNLEFFAKEDLPSDFPRKNLVSKGDQLVQTVGEVTLGVKQTDGGIWTFTFKSCDYMVKWMRHLRKAEAKLGNALLTVVSPPPPGPPTILPQRTPEIIDTAYAKPLVGGNGALQVFEFTRDDYKKAGIEDTFSKPNCSPKRRSSSLSEADRHRQHSRSLTSRSGSVSNSKLTRRRSSRTSSRSRSVSRSRSGSRRRSSSSRSAINEADSRHRQSLSSRKGSVSERRQSLQKNVPIEGLEGLFDDIELR